MTPLVPLALFGSMLLGCMLFAFMRPHRAVIVAFLGAWLFLPAAGYEFSGLPDFTKTTATCVGALLGLALWAPGRLLSLRPHWADLPMGVWCAAPFVSSIANDLGLYDGLAGIFDRSIQWGIPYLIGRVCFRDWRSLRELGIGIFIGGLVYVPLCLYEIRMSPQLHNIVYGFAPKWGNVHRGGGWRPMVFMKDGLMLGMWMTTASVMGAWLWYSGGLRRVAGLPCGLLLGLLLATTVLCKSAGALLLLSAGLSVLWIAKQWNSRVVLVLLLASAPVYMISRTLGGWSGAELLQGARLISDERAASLETRLVNENVLSSRALQRPVFGWGGWGRNRPSVEVAGRTITDGLWIIALGRNGVVGLAAVTLVQLLPAWLVIRRFRPSAWTQPAFGAPVAMAMMLILYCIDNIANGMVNPIFMVMAGALTSFCVALAPRMVERQPHVPAATAAMRTGPVTSYRISHAPAESR